MDWLSPNWLLLAGCVRLVAAGLLYWPVDLNFSALADVERINFELAAIELAPCELNSSRLAFVEATFSGLAAVELTSSGSYCWLAAAGWLLLDCLLLGCLLVDCLPLH
jgi:hypothetical protein